MNAMAAHAGTAQPAEQQIVVVNDGKDVESVGKKPLGIRLAKMAGIALVPLIVGVVVGKISASANVYNKTIDDSAVILEDLEKIKTSLIAVQQTFQDARTRGKGGNSFKVNDAQLTKDLEALELVQPNIEVVYHSFLYELPASVVGDVLTFYNETTLFMNDLEEHIEQSKADAKVLKEGQVQFEKAAANVSQRYAGLIELPKKQGGEGQGGPQIPMFKFVQLGPPICPGQTKPNPEGCGQGVVPIGFGYRINEMGNWGVKKITEMENEYVMGDRLIFFNPKTAVFEQMVKGGEASVAEVAYMKRVGDLHEKLKFLLELRTSIQKKLNNKANESKHFTFFM